jgi:hypothetical protein
MSLSSFIFIENQTGSGANALVRDWATPLPALSAVTASVDGNSLPAVRLDQTLNESLTCFVTSFYFQQTVFNGSPTYIAQQQGIFAATDGGNVFPFKLYLSDEGFNTLDFSLSATGNPSASGVQTGVVWWSLSSTALSATSAGVEVIEVLNQPVSFDGVTSFPVLSTATDVYCINSPFPPTSDGTYQYFSFEEFARMQQFLG